MVPAGGITGLADTLCCDNRPQKAGNARGHTMVRLAPTCPSCRYAPKFLSGPFLTGRRKFGQHDYHWRLLVEWARQPILGRQGVTQGAAKFRSAAALDELNWQRFLREIGNSRPIRINFSWPRNSRNTAEMVFRARQHCDLLCRIRYYIGKLHPWKRVETRVFAWRHPEAALKAGDDRVTLYHSAAASGEFQFPTGWRYLRCRRDGIIYTEKT